MRCGRKPGTAAKGLCAALAAGLVSLAPPGGWAGTPAEPAGQQPPGTDPRLTAFAEAAALFHVLMPTDYRGALRLFADRTAMAQFMTFNDEVWRGLRPQQAWDYFFGQSVYTTAREDPPPRRPTRGAAGGCRQRTAGMPARQPPCST